MRYNLIYNIFDEYFIFFINCIITFYEYFIVFSFPWNVECKACTLATDGWPTRFKRFWSHRREKIFNLVGPPSITTKSALYVISIPLPLAESPGKTSGCPRLHNSKLDFTVSTHRLVRAVVHLRVTWIVLKYNAKLRLSFLGKV